MEIIYGIGILMIVLFAKGIFDRRKAEKLLNITISKEWGRLPEQDFSERKLDSVQYYFQNVYKKAEKDIFLLDDITWNDLNMTELFFMTNNTGSAMGEEILWALLHDLKKEKDVLDERERIISFFQKEEEKRLKIRRDLAHIGKHKNISVYEYMDRMESVRQESNILHYVGISGIVLSVILLALGIGKAGILLITFIIFNLLTYYKRKGEIEIYYSIISYLIRMLEYSEKIAKEDFVELEKYILELRENTSVLKKFKKGAPAITAQNPTGDMLSFVLDYVRILFHTDLIRFNHMLKQYYDKKENLIRVFEIVGFLDAMCAAASFRELLKTYCVPEFTKEKQVEATGLYHPFLDNPVPADIKTEQSVLITGSNASGKSTFIKGMAINTILAQTLHTVCAKNYRASFFKVYTSMALTDNIFGHESYYIVEIKSLKRILDALEEDIPIICFVDEVLRGTNTVERIAASSRILHTVANSNAMMFAATHDIELTYMLEDCFDNYHFEEKIFDDEICFDYILKNGRATSQNAISLLGMLGYPESIIDKARAAAAHFLNEGEWEKI